MSAVVPRSGFDERLQELLTLRAQLDGQIAEVEFWRAEMAKAEEIIAQQADEAAVGTAKAKKTSTARADKTSARAT